MVLQFESFELNSTEQISLLAINIAQSNIYAIKQLSFT